MSNDQKIKQEPVVMKSFIHPSKRSVDQCHDPASPQRSYSTDDSTLDDDSSLTPDEEDDILRRNLDTIMDSDSLKSLCERLSAMLDTPAASLGRLRGNECDEKINNLVCDILVRLHRLGKENLMKNVRNTGLLALLVKYMDRVAAAPVRQSPGFGGGADDAMDKVALSLRCLSLEETMWIPMGREPGLPQALMQICNDDNQYSAKNTSERCRMNAVWAVSNIAYAPANRPLLAKMPGLIESAVMMASSAGRSHEVRGEAMRLIMNLSSDITNKVNMVRNKNFLSSLIRLLLDASPTVQTRALGTVKNLSSAQVEGKVLLVSFKDGALIEVLARIIHHGLEDPSMYIKALKILRNLCCPQTAETIGNCEGIFALLIKEGSRDEPENTESSSVARKALQMLAGSIRSGPQGTIPPCQSYLLRDVSKQTLCNMSTMSTCAMVLAQHASLGENCFAIATHKETLNTLADMSDSYVISIKRNALSAIRNVTRDFRCVPLLARDRVLSPLSRACELSGANYAECRRIALTIVVNLSTSEVGQKKIVKKERLMASLARYAAAPDEEDNGLKQNIIRTMMLLLPAV